MITISNLRKSIGFAFALASIASSGQTLTLKDAIDRGTAQYGQVVAKSRYASAGQETVKLAKREYLPNFNLSAQQDYGTINGQNGPLYGFGGLGVASSGLPLPEQSWNAAFGALYLANVNWEFFTFGRIKQRIRTVQAEADRLQKDYDQALFQHKVKISGAYLNLLASQRLLISQQKNLGRAEIFFNNVAVRAKNGLLPGVDSTLALAEVSRAKILLNQIRDQVKSQNNELVALLGDAPQDYATDTTMVKRIPESMRGSFTETDPNHPTRAFYQSRIAQSIAQEKLFKKEYFPSFTLFGIYQTRASGFSAEYVTDQTAFTQDYLEGIDPTRQNYLFGVGVVWNLTSIARASKKVSSQRLITQGLEEEYKAIDTELIARQDAASARNTYALANYDEAPVQVDAAQMAYRQRTALYSNGLSTLTDVTTALYTLNRAETDRDIAFTNVWQALLMQAAATGNFELFTNAL